MLANFEQFPVIKQMQAEQEVFWLNPNLDNIMSERVTKQDVDDAAERLARFAPYIKKVFPETGDGIIESPIKEIRAMQELLAKEEGVEPPGRLFLKCDSDLPVSGSIKARGGIYEVLCLAEEIALKNGLSLDDDYSVLADEKFKKVFSQYSIAVGSTGNLGLSIGIMGAKLGFSTTVHMSIDAKQWKKDLLREKGVTVVEHMGDFGEAVTVGRAQAMQNPNCHFVDDEKSKTLFLGYAVAARRLKVQLDAAGIAVDKDHPLFVYLPCGVGGAPGGVAYGLKQEFGENVHCFFVEPVQAPAVLLGVMTGLHERICAQDIGLSGKTIADGLAVSRPSAFVGEVCGNLLDGLLTSQDERMEKYVGKLWSSEGIFVEPSATAGFLGYPLIIKNFPAEMLKNSTHIAWATGGNMVPESEREYLIVSQK
ncbi:MAG: D-serine ammonia-lyase [Defluviitaleaceae bacterium]|nr:D-serine ammonia-lyase [Defluviitaleaceae bacterium]